jgi:hypothetical protein
MAFPAMHDVDREGLPLPNPVSNEGKDRTIHYIRAFIPTQRTLAYYFHFQKVEGTPSDTYLVICTWVNSRATFPPPS